MKRSVRLRLHDMVEAIEGIEMTTAGITFAQYQQSWQVRRAVERGIEIISEASRHVPEELKLRYPHIYWREIAGIGNLLRHERALQTAPSPLPVTRTYVSRICRAKALCHLCTSIASTRGVMKRCAVGCSGRPRSRKHKQAKASRARTTVLCYGAEGEAVVAARREPAIVGSDKKPNEPRRTFRVNWLAF